MYISKEAQNYLLSLHLYNQLTAMPVTKYTAQRLRTSVLWPNFVQFNVQVTALRAQKITSVILGFSGEHIQRDASKQWLSFLAAFWNHMGNF